MTQPTYKFIIEEPAKLKLLQNAWMDGNSWGFTKEQIINYLCYRVLWSNQGYLPMSQDIRKNDYVLHRPTIGKKFWGTYVQSPSSFAVGHSPHDPWDRAGSVDSPATVWS